MADSVATAQGAAYADASLSPELQRAIAKLTEINSLPEVTTKIVEVVEDPRATARDMHEIVRTDPALAAKILKVVNSAFYGLPSQIASLDRAILLLGLSAVKNIVLAASLSRMFKAEAVCDQFAARDLWHHCVSVGVCARLLAQASNAAMPDEAFVAGLVHDMGLIVAQQLFPAKLKYAVETCLNVNADFRGIELRVIGADHQALGGALAAKWKFPAGLWHAIANHHQPEQVTEQYRRTVSLVFVADVLSCRTNYGFWLTAHKQELTPEALVRAGVTQEQCDQVAEELPDRVKEAEQVLGD